MVRQPVSSSNLRSVGYEPARRLLEIEFHHGGVYQYTGVPEPVYRGLMGAGSKGSYHADHIKDRYNYRRIG
jgi:hypothetical protein